VNSPPDDEEQLEKNKEKITATNRAIGQKEEEKSRCEVEKVAMESAVSNHDMRMMQISQLLKLRLKRREGKELAEKVARLNEQLKELDFDRIDAERNELVRENNKYQSRRSVIMGLLDEKKKYIRSIETALAGDKLRLADKRFRDHSVALRCRQHVIDDLNKYYKALDWSIMQYHKERMTVINRGAIHTLLKIILNSDS
jgi:hypothetical protein